MYSASIAGREVRDPTLRVYAAVAVHPGPVELFGASKISQKILGETVDFGRGQEVQSIHGQALRVACVHLFLVEGCLELELGLHSRDYWIIIISI